MNFQTEILCFSSAFKEQLFDLILATVIIKVINTSMFKPRFSYAEVQQRDAYFDIVNSLQN